MGRTGIDGPKVAMTALTLLTGNEIWLCSVIVGVGGDVGSSDYGRGDLTRSQMEGG